MLYADNYRGLIPLELYIKLQNTFPQAGGESDTFTNNEITMIPIVRPVGWRINGRNDCTIDGRVAVSARVREYWSLRGQKPESAAATKIKQDFAKLVKWP